MTTTASTSAPASLPPVPSLLVLDEARNELVTKAPPLAAGRPGILSCANHHHHQSQVSSNTKRPHPERRVVQFNTDSPVIHEPSVTYISNEDKRSLWYNGNEIRRLKQATIPLVTKYEAKKLSQHPVHSNVLEYLQEPVDDDDDDLSEASSSDALFVSIRGLEFASREGQQRRHQASNYLKTILEAQQRLKAQQQQQHEEAQQAPQLQESETSSHATSDSATSPPQLLLPLQDQTEVTHHSIVHDCLFLKCLNQQEKKESDNEEKLQEQEAAAAAAKHAQSLELAQIAQAHSQDAVDAALQRAVQDAAFVCTWNIEARLSPASQRATKTVDPYLYYHESQERKRKARLRRRAAAQSSGSTTAAPLVVIKALLKRLVQARRKHNNNNGTSNNNGNNCTFDTEAAVSNCSCSGNNNHKMHASRPRVDTESTATLVIA